MSTTHLIEGWNKGAPLMTALLSFANDTERGVILGLETSIVGSVLQFFAETHALTEKQNISIADASAIINEKKDRDLDIDRQVRKRLFTSLRSRQLIAIGFEPPRQMRSEPFIIPIEYLFGNIDWKKNIVKYESLTFVDVRIVQASILPVQISVEQVTSSVGRKSGMDYYFACFETLQTQGKLDPTKSQKSHFQDIREWLSENYPETFPTPDIGNDKTIYRYFKAFSSTFKAK